MTILFIIVASNKSMSSIPIYLLHWTILINLLFSSLFSCESCMLDFVKQLFILKELKTHNELQNSRAFPCTLQPLSPNAKIICNHSVCSKSEAAVGTIFFKYRPYSDLTNFKCVLVCVCVCFCKVGPHVQILVTNLIIGNQNYSITTKKLFVLSHKSHTLPPNLASATTNLFFIIITLSLRDCYKGNHMVCNLQRLTFFAQYDVFETYPSC